MEGCYLLVCSSCLTQPAFFFHPIPPGWHQGCHHPQGTGPWCVNRSLRKCPYRPIWWGRFLNEDSFLFFLNNHSLCQIDMKLGSTVSTVSRLSFLASPSRFRHQGRSLSFCSPIEDQEFRLFADWSLIKACPRRLQRMLSFDFMLCPQYLEQWPHGAGVA